MLMNMGPPSKVELLFAPTMYAYPLASFITMLCELPNSVKFVSAVNISGGLATFLKRVKSKTCMPCEVASLTIKA